MPPDPQPAMAALQERQQVGAGGGAGLLSTTPQVYVSGDVRCLDHGACTRKEKNESAEMMCHGDHEDAESQSEHNFRSLGHAAPTLLRVDGRAVALPLVSRS